MESKNKNDQSSIKINKYGLYDLQDVSKVEVILLNKLLIFFN